MLDTILDLLYNDIPVYPRYQLHQLWDLEAVPQSAGQPVRLLPSRPDNEKIINNIVIVCQPALSLTFAPSLQPKAVIFCHLIGGVF